MKKTLWFLSLLILGTTGIGNAWADHVHFGVMIGPYWGPGYYAPPYYYPPYYSPVIVEQPAPQVYVEQPSVPPAPVAVAPASYWYYCAATKSYYPYARSCSSGWQRVSPQPPELP